MHSSFDHGNGIVLAAESPISSPLNPIRQETHDEERKKRFSGGVSIVVRLCLSPFHYQRHRRHGDTVVHAVARCDRQAPPIVSSFAFFFAACSLACFSSISKTFGSWHTQDGYGLYLVGFATCCLTPIFCLNIIKKH